MCILLCTVHNVHKVNCLAINWAGNIPCDILFSDFLSFLNEGTKHTFLTLFHSFYIMLLSVFIREGLKKTEGKCDHFPSLPLPPLCDQILVYKVLASFFQFIYPLANNETYCSSFFLACYRPRIKSIFKVHITISLRQLLRYQR